MKRPGPVSFVLCETPTAPNPHKCGPVWHLVYIDREDGSHVEAFHASRRAAMIEVQARGLQ